MGSRSRSRSLSFCALLLIEDPAPPTAPPAPALEPPPPPTPPPLPPPDCEAPEPDPTPPPEPETEPEEKEDPEPGLPLPLPTPPPPRLPGDPTKMPPGPRAGAGRAGVAQNGNEVAAVAGEAEVNAGIGCTAPRAAGFTSKMGNSCWKSGTGAGARVLTRRNHRPEGIGQGL